MTGGAGVHRLTIEDRRNGALADFAANMGRGGLAPSTIERVAKHVRKFWTETGATPYDVTPGMVAGWLDQLTCSTSASYAYRTSLRTFYRWAHRAGRVLTDPAARTGPHPLARAVPQSWGESLASFRRWQRAAGVAQSTQDRYAERLSTLARETGAQTPWDLTADDLADWLARHRWARETTRASRSTLRAFYGWAYDLGHVDDNPAAQLPRVRAAHPSPRPAPEDTYRTALHQASDDRDALALRLAAELGMRRGEVVQLHSADLVQDAGGGWWLTVHGKGGKDRRIPVPRELVAEIRRRPPGWAFPGRGGGHMEARSLGVRVSRLLPPGVTMHALRHRFATRAYQVDRDVFTVQRLLGHASPATTQRYVQTSEDDMRRLVEAVHR